MYCSSDLVSDSAMRRQILFEIKIAQLRKELIKRYSAKFIYKSE